MPNWNPLKRKKKQRKGSDGEKTLGKSGAVSATTTSSHVGLKTLYNSDDAFVDIVFVHGLTGDRERTWTGIDGTKSWPETILPKMLPQARILTFGYDADVVDWRSMVSRNRVGDHARNLLASLATDRENNETTDRPIIFVAHSLGGLVCEDALLSSKNSAERHLQKILDCTRGIAFLGTPHSGSGFATWAVMLAKAIGLVKQTNSEILGVLETDSEVLARIQIEFHNMIRARTHSGYPVIDITCFFEELPLPGVGKVVPRHSAILSAYMSIGIHANHMNMPKFETEDDPGFILVAGELQRWAKRLSTAPINSENSAATPEGQASYRHIGDNINSNILYGHGRQDIHGGIRIGS